MSLRPLSFVSWWNRRVIEASNRWFIYLLLSDLSIRVSDDDLNVMFWATVVLPLQLRIEGLLLVIGALKDCAHL